MEKFKRQAKPAPQRRGHLTQLALPSVAATGREREIGSRIIRSRTCTDEGQKKCEGVKGGKRKSLNREWTRMDANKKEKNFHHEADKGTKGEGR
jgi:hypothetical protein